MISDNLICPVCEVGILTKNSYADDFEHNGSSLHVEGLESCVCDTCGSNPILKEQIRYNHRLIVDARRRADGLLTGSEIRLLRNHLGLTQKDASELFGGGANAFSKYERGDVVQSVAMDRLLRIVGDHRELLDELRGEKARHEGSDY